MTNEEAIKILSSGGLFDGIGPEMIDLDDDDDEPFGYAPTMAFDAICEKMDRSRWAGCDYCNDPHPCRDCVSPDGTERVLCTEEGSVFKVYVNERKIKYCPMCGRPLTEEAWAELERRMECEF